MKQTHKQKIKMARKMRTRKETEDMVNIFDSAGWNQRKEARMKKLKKQMDNSKKKKINENLEMNKGRDK